LEFWIFSKVLSLQVVDFVRTLIDLPVGFGFASTNFGLEEEGFNACNPFQVGFSRAFCHLEKCLDTMMDLLYNSSRSEK